MNGQSDDATSRTGEPSVVSLTIDDRIKIGAERVNQQLLSGLRDENGVHVETFLSALGSIAGFCVQVSVRADPQPKMLTVARGADGKNYLFGDDLNRPLAEDPISIWSLAAGAAQSLGATLPDVTEIFAHTASVVGSEAFGIPRTPERYRAKLPPVELLKLAWPTTFAIAAQSAETSAEWPLVFGVAIQNAIFLAKDVIEPGLAVAIVMESAIPMSKIDLPELVAMGDGNPPPAEADRTIGG